MRPRLDGSDTRTEATHSHTSTERPLSSIPVERRRRSTTRPAAPAAAALSPPLASVGLSSSSLRPTGSPRGCSELEPSDDERATVVQSQTDFKAMFEFVCSLFPEARGAHHPPSRPHPPGEPDLLQPLPTPRFTRAQPMQFSLDRAADSLCKASDSAQSTLLRNPRHRVLRTYTVSGHEDAGWAARINPDLASALTIKSGEPRASVAQADLARLETSLAHLREAQNFTFWCLGAFFRLFRSLPAPVDSQAMGERLFRSIQRAMVDQASGSAIALANLKALRRESFLRYLPSSFSAASKRDLRKSSLDSGYLFDQARVSAALESADKTASLSFQQAAARALTRPRPLPGTPLTERDRRPVTGSSASRPARVTVPSRRFAPSRRPETSLRERTRTSGSATASFSNWGRGKSFRR